MKTKTRKQMLTEELASLCGMVRGSLVDFSQFTVERL